MENPWTKYNNNNNNNNNNTGYRMNRCLQETDIPQRRTKEKTPWSKKTPKKNKSQQLQTHNEPTKDVGNTSGQN